MTEDLDNPKEAGRFSAGKPQWSQVDFDSIEPMVRVLEYGAKKYNKGNWKKGMPVSEVCECLLRHTFALLKGEINDKESGLPHIGHVQCNAMFIAYILREHPEFDDVSPKTPESK
jgi:hypothetical protein